MFCSVLGIYALGGFNSTSCFGVWAKLCLCGHTFCFCQENNKQKLSNEAKQALYAKAIAMQLLVTLCGGELFSEFVSFLFFVFCFFLFFLFFFLVFSFLKSKSKTKENKIKKYAYYSDKDDFSNNYYNTHMMVYIYVTQILGIITGLVYYKGCKCDRECCNLSWDYADQVYKSL